VTVLCCVVKEKNSLHRWIENRQNNVGAQYTVLMDRKAFIVEKSTGIVLCTGGEETTQCCENTILCTGELEIPQ
jgi:hypothetical protein